MERDEVYLRAKKRMENLKAFYIHLTVYILVNLMLFIINISSDSSKLWFLYPLAGWGIVSFVTVTNNQLNFFKKFSWLLVF